MPVEKVSDELWLGVKGQSNWEIAGTVEVRAISKADSDENFKCFLGLLAVKRREKIRNKQSNE